MELPDSRAGFGDRVPTARERSFRGMDHRTRTIFEHRCHNPYMALAAIGVTVDQQITGPRCFPRHGIEHAVGSLTVPGDRRGLKPAAILRFVPWMVGMPRYFKAPSDVAGTIAFAL